MRDKLWRFAASIGSGAIAGGAVALALGSSLGTQADPPRGQGAVLVSSDSSAGERRLLRALSNQPEIRRNLDEVESTVGRRDGGVAPAEDPMVGLTELDREELRYQVEERYTNEVDEHFRGQRDAPWASQMESQLATRYSQGLSERLPNASLIDVDCRAETCAVVVEWPNRESARSSYERLVQDAWEGVNCAREMALPEAFEPGVPYQATLLLRCGR